MKKIIATGAMLAYITWFNSTGALAATMPEINAADDIQGAKHHQNARHGKHTGEKLTTLAKKFGFDATQLQLDLAAGLSAKQMMKKYDLTKNQYREIVGKRPA